MQQKLVKTLPFSIESQYDLQKLIDLKVKEDMYLSFKSWKEFDLTNTKKRESLSILVSSFANSIGGKIFFGIETQRRKANGLQPNFISNETIEQLHYFLDLSISPSIEKLEIKKINIEDSKSVLVITIPNSDIAPHMAEDNRFYRRFELKECLMQEYEIRDLYQRSKKAEIDIYAILNTNGIPTIENGKFQKVNFYPRFLIKNVSSVIEHHYKMELYIPSGIYNSNFSVLQQHFSRLEEHYTVFSITNSNPLFQHEIATVIDANLVIDSANFELFSENDIIIKLYYSTGIKTKYFKLIDTFLYQNKQLQHIDFEYQHTLFA